LQCLAVTKTTSHRPETLNSIHIKGLTMRHYQSLSIKYNGIVLNSISFPNYSRHLDQVTDRGGGVYPFGVCQAPGGCLSL